MYVLIGIVTVMVQYLVVAGKTLRTAWVSTLGTVGFAITALILVPRYQGLGFLIAQVVGQLIGLPLVGLPVIREMEKHERSLLRNLAILTGLSLGITLLITLAGLSQMATVALSISLVSVMSLLVFITVLESREQNSLRDIVTVRVLRYIS
jgi:O-antigen/teichoic acid export membrane protein